VNKAMNETTKSLTNNARPIARPITSEQNNNNYYYLTNDLQPLGKGKERMGSLQKVQEDKVYIDGEMVSGEDGGSPEQVSSETFQTKLQSLYGRLEEPDKEQNFMRLAKGWNASSPGHEIVEEGPQILMVLNDTVEEGVIGVAKEVMSSECEELDILTILDNEIGQTKQLDSHDMGKRDYSAMCQDDRARVDADCHIRLHQLIAEGSADTNDGVTEWIMANGLKVFVGQGDVVEALADVITNPSYGELMHVDAIAKANFVEAGKESDDECDGYIKQGGSGIDGNVVGTRGGKLKPREKHETKAHKECNRQDNWLWAQAMVLGCLEEAERGLKAISMQVTSIAWGSCGVPKIGAAKALCKAFSKFDEAGPKFVKTVLLVISDISVIYLINKELARVCGGVPRLFRYIY